ncbi:MAG: UDP-2,3-diacylglucosamine diphosphatase [Methylococcaceae bacterium]|nr:MAG: UDP-2,3-diacylglucosamine diphosphatase [Methylococcaceae bacterium]
MGMNYRTVWVSDVHLGTRGCKADFLLDFLRSVECDCLYLVGDIIDFWKLRGGGYWPQLHSELLRTVMGMAKRGIRVIYIPGNHDEFFRDYTDTVFGGIEIQTSAIHTGADGRRFLVLHGDEFDGVVCSSRWLAVAGSEVYDMLLVLNRWFNLMRRKLGFPYWSLSAYLKYKVKNAVNFIGNYEKTLVHAAAEQGVDGIICGHIHHPAIQQLGNITYCNSGDWVESCTALTEDHNGTLSILRWADRQAALAATALAAPAVAA